jgi:hypothetical protein
MVLTYLHFRILEISHWSYRWLQFILMFIPHKNHQIYTIYIPYNHSKPLYINHFGGPVPRWIPRTSNLSRTWCVAWRWEISRRSRSWTVPGGALGATVVGVGWKKTVLIVRDDSKISYTIHTYLHTYIRTYIYTYTCIFIYLFFIYLFMYLFVYLCIYRNVHIYMYIYLVS